MTQLGTGMGISIVMPCRPMPNCKQDLLFFRVFHVLADESGSFLACGRPISKSYEMLSEVPKVLPESATVR